MADRQSRSLTDAKELAGLVIEKLGLKVPEWHESVGTISPTPWEHAYVDVGSGIKMTVGASSEGGVSISRDPYFTQGSRTISSKLRTVEESMKELVTTLRREYDTEVEQRTIDPLAERDVVPTPATFAKETVKAKAEPAVAPEPVGYVLAFPGASSDEGDELIETLRRGGNNVYRVPSEMAGPVLREALASAGLQPDDLRP
jgi:hypothetical protein